MYLRKTNCRNVVSHSYHLVHHTCKIQGWPSIGLNLNHRLLIIWQYLCHSILSQNLVYHLYWIKWIDLRLSNVGIYWANEKLRYDVDFAKKKKKKISDDTRFHLGGYVNKQNCRIPITRKIHKWPYRSQCFHYK